MVAKKATSTKSSKKELTEEAVMTMYMEYVLENGKRPASVFKFCKDHKIQEGEFYNLFGSFQGIRESIWIAFYENTISVLHKNLDYKAYPNREKMLAFFYTFFEVLTANRSYVLFALEEEKNQLKSLAQLRDLRIKVREFAGDLIEQANDEKSSRLSKNPVSIFSEGAWLQTLFLLKYWMDDNSARFEKTDVAIEKSVNAIFDVFNTTPLESVLDFGKFLLKENFTKTK
ncbi:MULTISPECIES: TetR family transcriptional regulator C-terminal domain-containing protein [unclassified Leeuwenhoekiella]|uniref:TetR/AcrR family transcriptional regulator n=1 Tax=unclassified Leeuwenhoekiella TaxID=2615029 RepID=UPI000C63D375|nr:MULTISPECIES: TetR family transcriptional regulator C-terminal domain-containing protein [unclassified Leeuwenhoekiella]MAW97136.1 heat-shock protein [Leeuwenhoekiella sp.]MBA82652.1 heat-shock protein [Leeuwenhoekiella sp.]|tara:strand:- start:29985 stop:30671 length:687 start_codon:yes stop_codon:yes gene_type:complete